LDIQQIIMIAGVAGTVFMAALALISLSGGHQRQMKRRIKALKVRLGSDISIEEKALDVRREDETSAPGLDKVVLKFLPRPSILIQRLSQAGLTIGLGVYVTISLAVAFVATLGVGLGLKLPFAIALLFGLALGIGAPHMVVSLMIARRNRQFVAAFPDAIDLIVRGVKSGLPITEGIAACSREMPNPVSGVFKQITDNMKVGQTMEEALWEAADKLSVAEFKFFVISLVVQAETGGNLAETLGNLADILRQRQQMKLKIRAMASEARASAAILGSLPFAMTVILYIASPDYMSVLFTDTRGQMVGVLGISSVLVGCLTMFKMASFKI